MIEFKLPSLGAEMDEGTLIEWKVKPGDAVHKGDVVAVVDTSKSAIDVEIWQDGIVDELLLEPHQKVPVGTVIARLLEPGETREHAEAQKAMIARGALAPAPIGLAAPLPLAPAPAAGPAVPATRAPVPPLAPAMAAKPPAAAAPAAPPRTETRRRVSPAARLRAETLGIDLAQVTGTGPQNAVTLEDVERAAAAATQAAAAVQRAAEGPAKASAAERALAMRAAIGAAMARSKREIPHYYLASDIVMARATQWLAARNARRPVTERVLMAAVQLKAVAMALKSFPDLNGYYRDGAFVPGSGIHLGVAISLRQGGLIAPAIRDVDALGLDALMKRLTDLVARTRALTLRSSEMTDATITVTNLGDQGVDLVQGVIYPPQVALVGLGRVRERPWVEAGRLMFAPVLTASLSADHRASDGHRGALFLNELSRLLQAPESLDEAAK